MDHDYKDWERVRLARTLCQVSSGILITASVSFKHTYIKERSHLYLRIGFFYKHDSHKATCSLRYERQGQARATPGLAARQLKSMGLLCKRHLLSSVFIDGAKILLRAMMVDVLQGNPAL